MREPDPNSGRARALAGPPDETAPAPQPAAALAVQLRCADHADGRVGRSPLRVNAVGAGVVVEDQACESARRRLENPLFLADVIVEEGKAGREFDAREIECGPIAGRIGGRAVA